MILSCNELNLNAKYCYTQITKALPGRTDNAIKNRFHATCRAQSRKEAADDDKSTCHSSEGNTDSDSVECSDTTSNPLSDVPPHGPTAVMVQTAYSGLPLNFKFENSVPFVFDECIPPTDLNNSLYSTISSHGGSLLQNFRAAKCVKKPKKVTGVNKNLNDNSTLNELLTAKASAPHVTAWINPMHDTQISALPCLISHSDTRGHSQYHPQQTISTLASTSMVVSPTALINSPSLPIKIPTSVISHPSISCTQNCSLDQIAASPVLTHKSAVNGLSLRERHGHSSVLAHASSPTLSDDFRMTIPSGSSIDIDENLFDDWMDDGTELGTHTEYTTEIDVPFYQSSFEWGIDGCCAMGSNVASTCFSSNQVSNASSGYGYGENSESLCGFQRLSYGQGHLPSQLTQSKVNTSGFFSSLGGRICGTPKIDSCYDVGNQQSLGQAQYPVNYGSSCHMDDFENLMPSQSNQTQLYR